jgi:spore germination protein GerM
MKRLSVQVGPVPGVALVTMLVVVTAAGCGVPAEDAPRPFTPIGTAPIDVTPSVSPNDTISATPGGSFELLYLVRDGRLTPIRRTTQQAPSIDEQLAHLLAGPTDAERDTGLTSTLTGLTITRQVRLQAGTATVEIGNRPEVAARSDEVLAYGQIVCTLTARPDVDTVTFSHDGQPVGIPRADASLTQNPLTAADYATLIEPA